MNYKSFNLGDWINHISGVIEDEATLDGIEDEATLDGNETRDLIKFLKTLNQESILDKIKAEILDEAEYAYADFERYKEDILHAEPDELPDDDFRYGLERAVEIIDKYKS